MLGLFGCNAEHSTCIENPNPVVSTKENIQEEIPITILLYVFMLDLGWKTYNEYFPIF